MKVMYRAIYHEMKANIEDEIILNEFNKNIGLVENVQGKLESLGHAAFTVYYARGISDLTHEIGRLTEVALSKSREEELTIWLVEEETGEAIKLDDYINSNKHSEEGKFKRIL